MILTIITLPSIQFSFKGSFMKFLARPLILSLVLAFSAASSIAAEAEFSLVISDHKFEPAELRIPANKKVKLIIENKDSTPEEFESHSMNREKVIPGKSKATIFIGPLKAGKYDFVGEFNPKTAQGVVIAE
jgi:hypothetical protein